MVVSSDFFRLWEAASEFMLYRTRPKLCFGITYSLVWRLEWQISHYLFVCILITVTCSFVGIYLSVIYKWSQSTVLYSDV